MKILKSILTHILIFLDSVYDWCNWISDPTDICCCLKKEDDGNSRN
jgi:hypothetical protein